MLDEHDESLINKSILNKAVIDEQKRTQTNFETKKERSGVLNLSDLQTRKSQQRSTNSLKYLKHVYQSLKSSHMVECSQTRKCINRFILLNLKRDFDGKSIKENNFIEKS